MSAISDALRRPATALKSARTKPRQPQAEPPPQPAKAEPKPEENTELRTQRDRLLEKFTIMQADLGGAFYEMAIRDHVRMDVLTRKAAELQRVDADLLAIERMLELQRADAAGMCPSCGSPYGPAGAFLPPVRPRAGDGGRAVKAAFAKQVQRLVAAAATLTGKRFGVFVASSVVATSAIVASAMTGTGGSGPLAALLGRSLASQSAPLASTPTPRPRVEGGSSSTSGSGSPAPAAAPLPAPAPAPAPASAPSEAAAKKTTPAPAEPESEAGRVKHVFVISLTSPGYERSLGAQSQMPYLSATLRPQGELLSNYTLLDSGALPNGIAAISGQPPNAATSAGCPGYEDFTAAQASGNGVLSGAGCVYPVETLTLADQLTSGKLTWRSYAEGMVDEAGKPANCVHPDPGEPSAPAQPGGYAPSQNPFGYFHSLLDLGDCTTYDVPIDQLSKDLGKAEKTASYSFIAPTPCSSGAAAQCVAGAAEGPASADAFLSTWVPKILASPAYKTDGVLIVTFLAVDPPAPGAPATEGDPLRTGALLLSPFATPGGTDAAAYNPYSLLRSAEDLFGLDPLALAGNPKTKSFAPGLLEENSGD